MSLTDILNQTLDEVAEAKFAGVVGIDGVGVELIFNEADDGIDANLAELELAALAASASGASERVGSGAVRAFTIEAEALTYLAALVTPPGEAPRPSLMTLCDVLGGLVCAEGTVAALEARERTGRAQRTESSLLSAARLLLRPGSGPPALAVPVRTDLAALAADPRLAPALEHAACTLVRTPWEFRP